MLSANVVVVVVVVDDGEIRRMACRVVAVTVVVAESRLRPVAATPMTAAVNRIAASKASARIRLLYFLK